MLPLSRDPEQAHLGAGWDPAPTAVGAVAGSRSHCWPHVNGTATAEDSLAVPYRAKYNLTI